MRSQDARDSERPSHILSTRTGYDLWSNIYDEEDNPLIALETPHVLRMLGEVAGLSVIDIGCGTGRHSLLLALAGAHVTAVDFSAGMLAKAKEKPGARRVRFLVHDLTGPLPMEDDSFDRVLCALVLDHIEDVDGVFCEFKRLCRPDGWIVISVMHPAMMLRGIQARFIDPETGHEVRPRSCPNQISHYVMAAVRAGLMIAHLSEHLVDQGLAARSPRAEKHLGWPMLLMMRCIPASNTARQESPPPTR